MGTTLRRALPGRSAEGVIERRIPLSKRGGTETAMRWVLDPECPVVAEFMETLFGDPTIAMGAPVEDILKNSNVGTASSVSGVRNMPFANV
jgi:hypothetical protein